MASKWSKQTYEAVAAILNKHLQDVKFEDRPLTTYQEGHITATSDIASDFAKLFKRDNSLFQPEKFIEAVNTGAHIRKSIKSDLQYI